ncbi:MAG: glycosyltransferase family 4 protein [Bacilli bacterium]|jgi:glycosyltransferase involved in cell wall biosynthesis|nr:glycosyltransferase family 4 protein [Bacilli bacterium]
MKALWIFNHPAPYKVDFFNELGKKCELTVLFERPSEADRNPGFYCEKVTNFSCKILKSIHLGPHNNYTGKAVNEIKGNHYDLIVVNGYSTFTEMKLIRYLHRHRIPYIFAINGGIIREKESWARRVLKRKYISHASLYLAPDPRSAEYLKFYGAEESKIRLYPYSTVYAYEVLSKPSDPATQKRLRDGLHIDGKRFYVSVGQFIRRKNNFALLSIWKEMPKTSRLLLIGNGPEKDNYAKYVTENGLTNVTIMDYEPHTKILGLFRLADFSLFLTKEDIYGHVVNESLSQGTPVISNQNANSALNLIENGKNGYLVNLNEPKAIVKRLMSPSTEELRNGAIATAKKNTIEAMAERHLEIFKELLGK